MCGVAGMFHQNGITDDDKRLLLAMSDSIKHRGPDGKGEYFGDKIGLCHRRLSIIDTSEAGAQPMSYMNRYIGIFNGEIYNYKEIRKELKDRGYNFQSKTDTEVLLAAYDYYREECCEKMNGMWAFLIYDKKENQLFISRDRFGVKPLFYYVGKDYILFASEIKALLCDARIKRIANEEIVYDFLVDGFIDHTDQSFFKGIHKVPAGSYCVIDIDELKKPDFQKFYSSDFINVDNDMLIDEATEKFRKLFVNSIRVRLRSDVPIGTCLSGGLDSSSIVSTVYRFNSNRGIKQHTFSFCPQDEKISEKRYIDEVIKDTQIQEHYVDDSEFSITDDYEQFIKAQDEPFMTMSMFAGYLVYKEAKKNNIKVLLDGQGADEILCGYRKSRVYYLKDLIKHYKYLTAMKEFVLSISQIKTTSSIKSDSAKLKKIIFKSKRNDKVGSQYLNKTFTNKFQSKNFYFDSDFQRVNVNHISLPQLLRYVDRNSMSVSVESRLPFLDYMLVDYVAKMPLSLKIHNGYSKYIMRRSLPMPNMIRKRKDKIR